MAGIEHIFLHPLTFLFSTWDSMRMHFALGGLP